MGGYSSEVEISLKSGNVVYNNISKEIYNPYRVHILTEKWVLLNENNEEFKINKHDFSAIVNGNKINFGANAVLISNNEKIKIGDKIKLD